MNPIEETPRRFAQPAPIGAIINDTLPYSALPLACIHGVRGTSLASGAIVFEIHHTVTSVSLESLSEISNRPIQRAAFAQKTALAG
jgi:hypothetical protein